jgi:hydroxymethylbilane synthase
VFVAATRASALARWQTDHVAGLLTATHDGLELGVEVVETTADRRLDVQIWELGGKGAFVKEVQAAVLDGRARFAVHSAKDLPALTHPDLVIAAVPQRADARDVLVGATLDTLASGATVATGSLRRQVQLRALRPDLEFIGLRGNIATRLDRIPPGGAIVMAAAAIDRLGLAGELAGRGIITEVLDVERFVPQVGQGALAVECRRDDDEALALLRAVEHQPSRTVLDAERAFLVELGGDCELPAGAHATLRSDGTVEVRAVLAALDASALVADEATGSDGVALGAALARSLRLALDAS